MELKEELAGLIGVQRKFMLLRIADISLPLAKNICKVSDGTYNTWVRRVPTKFSELYQRLEELTIQFRDEAILLLRRDNQLAAVMLEAEIIEKVREEVRDGEYKLTKTHLAREVYSKLMADLDATPRVQIASWEQRAEYYFNEPRGEVIDGQYEEAIRQPNELGESQLLTQSV